MMRIVVVFALCIVLQCVHGQEQADDASSTDSVNAFLDDVDSSLGDSSTTTSTSTSVQCSLSAGDCIAVRARQLARVSQLCSGDDEQQDCAAQLRSLLFSLSPSDSALARPALLSSLLQTARTSCHRAALDCSAQHANATFAAYVRLLLPVARPAALAADTAAFAAFAAAARALCLQKGRCRRSSGAADACLKDARPWVTVALRATCVFSSLGRIEGPHFETVLQAMVARAVLVRQTRIEELFLRDALPLCTSPVCRDTVQQLQQEAVQIRGNMIPDIFDVPRVSGWKRWAKRLPDIVAWAWAAEYSGNASAVAAFIEQLQIDTAALITKPQPNATVQLLAQKVRDVEDRTGWCLNHFSRCSDLKGQDVVLLNDVNVYASLRRSTRAYYRAFSATDLGRVRQQLMDQVAGCWTSCNIPRVHLSVVSSILVAFHVLSASTWNFLRISIVDPAVASTFDAQTQFHLRLALLHDRGVIMEWVLDPALALPSIICMALIILLTLLIFVLTIAKGTLKRFKWHGIILACVAAVAALRLSVYAFQWIGLRIAKRTNGVGGGSLTFAAVPSFVATPVLTFVLLVFLFFFLDGLYEGVLFTPPFKRFSLFLGIVLGVVGASVLATAIYGGLNMMKSGFMPRDFETPFRIPETFFISIIACCAIVFLSYCIAGLAQVTKRGATRNVVSAMRRLLVCAACICVAVMMQLVVNVLSYRTFVDPPMWTYVLLGYVVPETIILGALLFYVAQPFLVADVWSKSGDDSTLSLLMVRDEDGEEIPYAYQ